MESQKAVDSVFDFIYFFNYLLMREIQEEVSCIECIIMDR